LIWILISWKTNKKIVRNLKMFIEVDVSVRDY
jgi:hypothetical protein